MKESIHFLSPGEAPPPVIPFPSSPVCPKCGTSGGFIFRPPVFAKCHKCGYVKEIVRVKKPLTKRMLREDDRKVQS